MLRKKFSLLILFALLSLPVISQDFSVDGELDKSVISIGEQSTLKLSVSVPEHSKVVWPAIGDTIISEIEIVKIQPIDSTSTGGTDNYVQSLTITSFDSGYYAIPPFSFRITLKDGTDTVVETNAFLYEVHTVAIDTTADIRDIMPIVDMPLTFKEVIPYMVYGLIGVALIVGIVLLIILYKKRKSVSQIFHPKYEVPPHRKALDNLYALEKQKLWQSGDTKEYYFLITSILREYISGQFRIDAVEMVTDDIFDELYKTEKCTSDDIKIAQEIFMLSDFVKFAKHQPQPDENAKVLEEAFSFVNNSYKYYSELMKSQEANKQGGQNV